MSDDSSLPRRLTETPAGVKLGPLALIADGAARNFVLEMKAGRFHGFVVRRGETVHGYVDRCPHMGLPLARDLDDYMTQDRSLIACSWHGALFRIGDYELVTHSVGNLSFPIAVQLGILK